MVRKRNIITGPESIKKRMRVKNQTLNDAQLNRVYGKGYEMTVAMGYKQDKGLGKDGVGSATIVNAKQQLNRKGLGFSKKTNKSYKTFETSEAYSDQITDATVPEVMAASQHIETAIRLASLVLCTRENIRDLTAALGLINKFLNEIGPRPTTSYKANFQETESTVGAAKAAIEHLNTVIAATPGARDLKAARGQLKRFLKSSSFDPVDKPQSSCAIKSIASPTQIDPLVLMHARASLHCIQSVINSSIKVVPDLTAARGLLRKFYSDIMTSGVEQNPIEIPLQDSPSIETAMSHLEIAITSAANARDLKAARGLLKRYLSTVEQKEAPKSKPVGLTFVAAKTNLEPNLVESTIPHV